MKRSTEWFISGALVFGMAIFFYMIKVDVEQRAFWFGTGNIPPIQVAIMRLSPFMVPVLLVFGIVCFAMGLSKAGIITVEREVTPKEISTPVPTPIPTQEMPTVQKEIIAKEVVMIPCEYCKALIPQISVFCPNCGVRRKG